MVSTGTGGADGADFGVGGRVVAGDDAVPAFGDDLAVAHDDRADAGAGRHRGTDGGADLGDGQRTQFVDVLVLGSLNRALLFATSKAARETFAKLVHESFGFVVNRCTSGFVALENVDEAGKLMPTVWPGRGPKQLELPGIQDFLGCEFLLWLWHGWETFGGTFSVVGVGEVGIAIDDRVEFSAASDETSLVLRHGLTARAAEARAALRAGRVPTKARLLIAEGSRQWTATIDGASLALTSVRGPDDSEECESSEDITADRASNWVALNMIVEQLFLRFVAIRSSDDWKKRAAEIGAWMGGGGA